MTTSASSTAVISAAASTSSISNKDPGITDQAASTSSVSNQGFGITDQAGSSQSISNKALDVIQANFFDDPSVRVRVANKAHTESGGIELQVNGVDQPGRQPIMNFVSSGDARPVGTGSFDAGAGLAYSLTPDSFTPEVGLINRTQGVNLLLGGSSVPLFDAPGKDTVILGCSLVVTAASGITSPAKVGIGTNLDLDNIFESQFLTGFGGAVGEIYEFPPGGAFAVARPPGSSILIGIDVGATGSVLTVDVLLFGYVRNS